jgi:hypothetical protein
MDDDLEFFTEAELEGAAFTRWPRVDGLLRPGMYHDRDRDVMWVCLASVDDLDVAEVWLAGHDAHIACLVDPAGAIVALGISSATLVLPPAALVPGALPSMPVLWNPESDTLQIRFFDGPVLDDVQVWELRPEPGADRVLRFVWEPGRILATIAVTPASELVHASVLASAADEPTG